MRRVATRKAANHTLLSEMQRHRIMTAALQLRPDQRDAFILRIEWKLHPRTHSRELATAQLLPDLIVPNTEPVHSPEAPAKEPELLHMARSGCIMQ